MPRRGDHEAGRDGGIPGRPRRDNQQCPKAALAKGREGARPAKAGGQIMKNPERFDDRTWRRLFAFLVPEEKNMTRQEVEAELQHLGIDTRPGFAKIQQALKRISATREARAAL